MLLKYWDPNKTILLLKDPAPVIAHVFEIVEKNAPIRKYYYDSFSEALCMEREYLSRHVPVELETVDGNLSYYSSCHQLWLTAIELAMIYNFPYPKITQISGNIHHI